MQITQVEITRDILTRLYVVSITGEYFDDGVEICFPDPDDAAALSELLKRATSIIF